MPVRAIQCNIQRGTRWECKSHKTTLIWRVEQRMQCMYMVKYKLFLLSAMKWRNVARGKKAKVNHDTPSFFLYCLPGCHTPLSFSLSPVLHSLLPVFLCTTPVCYTCSFSLTCTNLTQLCNFSVVPPVEMLILRALFNLNKKTFATVIFCD